MNHLMQHATFRQLQVFDAIARHGSFTRAAEELALSQPTVSMQVKKLADDMGVALFEHVGRRVRLSEAGQALWETCREIFAALERFDMTLASLQGLSSGTLHLAAVNTAKYFVPLILGAFCKPHPGIRATLEVSDREQILQRLAQGRDDLYVMSEPPPDIAVQCVPFLDNPLVVAAPPDHPLVNEHAIALSRLAGEPLLVREPSSATRHATDRLFAAQGLRPNVRMQLANNEAIKQAIIGGLGIAVLSRVALAAELAGGRLKLLDVRGFPLSGQWYLVFAKAKPLSVVAKAFLTFVQSHGPAIVSAAEPAAPG